MPFSLAYWYLLTHPVIHSDHSLCSRVSNRERMRKAAVPERLWHIIHYVANGKRSNADTEGWNKVVTKSGRVVQLWLQQADTHGERLQSNDRRHCDRVYITLTCRERQTTRMWDNAQRDGRPAEYRWRPLFNAAKFR